MARPTTVRPPDRRRLTGAWRGLRDGRPSTDGPEPVPDDRVLALVADPFTSIDDAHGRLRTLEAYFRTRGDRRGAFLAVYARVTGEVSRAIREDAFADPAWTADYLVTFADLYRRALAAYETGDLAAVPDPWQIAFDTAARGDCLVAQDVVLGINAHVNYDLALALHAVGLNPDRDRKYADHCAVNRILRQLVDEVQDVLAAEYAPGIETFDESLGRLDETVGFFTLREGRDSAWRSAVALDSRWALRRRAARWVLRTAATGAAHVIRAPNVAPSLHDRLRELERQPEMNDQTE